MSLDLIPGDRRSERRYEFASPLQFRYTGESGEAKEGWGQTTDLSREAIRFQSETLPPVGVQLEARIAWPFLLQGVCKLELVVLGSIRKVTDRGAVLSIQRYEFRTCGDRSFVEAQYPLGEFRVA
jgi:hypothetical protein